MKVHKNALFHSKCLKNFLWIGHSPFPDPTPARERYTRSPDPGRPPRHLWLLFSAPWWLKPPQ